jgi:uncharacterized protein (DUF58 family)
MSEALLDPSFARELEALRRRMQMRARSGRGGERLARRRGGSAEFLEHRGYTQGDDPRRIDWLAFARTGEPVLKLFRAEEDVIVRLLVDASASMEAGVPSKLLAAKRIAASLGYIALAESERAQVLVAGVGLTRTNEPARGRASLPKLLRDLDAPVARGRTDLARAIDAVVHRSSRPGMLVVASDFLDAGALDGAVVRAASAGHDISLVQVLAADEMTPTLDGDYALEDSETGALVEATIDAATIDAYLARLAGLFASLAALAKRSRASYVRSRSDEPTIAVVRRIVARSIEDPDARSSRISPFGARSG